MNPNYSYLRFGAMPYKTPSNPVSPKRPLNMCKKMYKVDFAQTPITVVAGGELECIFMEGYLAGTNSEPIALFYIAQPNQTSTSPDRQPLSRKPLTGKPDLATTATCYIGGFLKVTHTSGTGPCVFQGRYYEHYNNTSPATWNDVLNSGPSAVQSLVMTGDSVFVSCMPSELKAKRFYQLAFPDFHRISYHFKVKNNGADSMVLNLSGSWWLETYEAIGTSPVTFTDDSKCPYKLAEFVFGHLRNTKMYTLQTNVDAEYANLDDAITNALVAVVAPWQVITSNIEFGIPAPIEADSDEEWESRPKIWNR